MKRRDFLQGAAAVTCLASATRLAAAEADHSPREYYEWRTYRLAGSEQQPRVTSFLEQAALPAWQRLGLGPVGVFTETGPQAASAVHVLLTYPTLELFAAERTAVEQDAAYQQAAGEYLSAAQQDPAFERIESSLLVAFAGMPRLAVPQRRPRVLQLREYHSHSEAKARRKIEMFNAGEIPLFPAVGFENVFFGETLIGPRLPNLKYLIAAETFEDHDANFNKFRVHPTWVAMKDLPEYAETVSQVLQTFLVPTPFSQI